MSAFHELAIEINSLITAVDCGRMSCDAAHARIRKTLRAADELIRRGPADANDDGAAEYCAALQGLAECLRRRESTLIDRKLHLASQLRHLRNVNQWAQSSAQTM